MLVSDGNVTVRNNPWRGSSRFRADQVESVDILGQPRYPLGGVITLTVREVGTIRVWATATFSAPKLVTFQHKILNALSSSAVGSG